MVQIGFSAELSNVCVRELYFSVKAKDTENFKLSVADSLLKLGDLPRRDFRKRTSIRIVSYFLSQTADFCQGLENDRLVSALSCQQKASSRDLVPVEFAKISIGETREVVTGARRVVELLDVNHGCVDD